MELDIVEKLKSRCTEIVSRIKKLEEIEADLTMLQMFCSARLEYVQHDSRKDFSLKFLSYDKTATVIRDALTVELTKAREQLIAELEERV